MKAMNERVSAFLSIGILALMGAGPAQATVVNFEGLSDSTLLTNQIAGLTFTNTKILTAGISLNEVQFPPFSGANVAAENGTSLTILFAAPQASAGAYFTYNSKLTLTAYDASNNVLGTIQSNFSENWIGSANNSPNEFLSLAAANISSLT